MRQRKRAELSTLEHHRALAKTRERATIAIIVSVLVGGGALAFRAIQDVKSPHATANTVTVDRSSGKPLGRPPQTDRGVGTFSFAAEQSASDEPVAYDPCRTIPWAIHDELAPPGTDRIIEDAVREVAEATGLVFVREEAGPLDDYRSVTAKDGRSPVIIDWTTPREVRGLEGLTAGVGGSAFLSDVAGVRLYVTGAVALDTPQLETILDQHGPATVRAIVMHELGHVVGLDHVDDPDELMYADSVGRSDFGPGDREGLAMLGAGRCSQGWG